MNTLPEHAEIVIVGGGIMGVSAAYHLVRRGVSRIVLLERESTFGHGSTGRAAGGFRHQFSTDINIQLSIKSIAMLDNFESEVGFQLDIRYCGYLFLLSTPAEVEVFQRGVERQHANGVPTEVWTREQIAQRVPLLNMEGIIAGTYYGRDGIASPADVVHGYAAAARRQGVQLMSGVTVTGIELKHGAVSAVLTSHGRIRTPLVVNAAGPWSATVAAMVGLDLPVKPERQQTLVTTPIPQLPLDFPMVIEIKSRLNMMREGPGILTGMSMTGFPATFDQAIDPEWTLRHMDKAMERLPILESAGKLTEWAGLYEVTPDAHPIIGPLAAVPGFYALAGFSGHGFMHGPIAGLLLSEQIVDGRAHTLDITALRAERFAEGDLIHESHVA